VCRAGIPAGSRPPGRLSILQRTPHTSVDLSHHDKIEFAVNTKPSLASLTALYLKIGNTTFGGGDPTMASLQRDLIGRKWITREDFALAYSLARVTPGTNVLAFCAATGARVLGAAGALAAVLAVTLPSAILAVLLTRGFEAWRTTPWAMAALGGTVAAVSGMMWASVWSLVKPYIGWRVLLFTGGAFIAAWKFHVTPVPIILIAALAGYAWSENK
jgi:chromate transporter